MEITKRLELIDFFFLILCLRVIYIAVLRGVLIETFKILGVIFGSLFAFQYYPLFSERIDNKRLLTLFEGKIGKPLDFFFFLSIFLGILLIFSLLGKTVGSLLKKEELTPKEKWASFFIGLGRFIFLSSISFFLLSFFPFNVSKSFSYGIFKNIAPQTYLLAFKVYNKFSPKVKINKEVESYYETQRTLPRSSKKGH